MKCEQLWDAFRAAGVDFFTGVPDSTFGPWMSFLADRRGEGLTDIVASNEGEAVAIATGYHLATGRLGVVYMQNSGLGNAVNPLTSLADSEVYSVPMILLIGWRGEPGRKDEPQHVKMGRIMLPLLEALEIKWRELPTDAAAAAEAISNAVSLSVQSKAPVALIVRSGVVDTYSSSKPTADSDRKLTREQALSVLLDALPQGAVSVSTTGKTSRELFELRERRHESHEQDFLTVGSMGLASAIALGIAVKEPSKPVVVFDGDGALLMHAGNMAAIGKAAPANYYHVLFDNGVHDSTGGQTISSENVQQEQLATAFGYAGSARAGAEDALQAAAIQMFSVQGPYLLVVDVRRGARKDLGRPTTTPIENKKALMGYLGPKAGI